ncbi:hypothetical protein ACFFMN_23200 [Planobispora siamensis]|uniref:Uncharacterized protein n=1 Tax=Planobispora siamensis TaxID=936338 RepID=A0A8J3WLG4_9ACTN|nr:hypothetical protein [Planobispora siamensis]GIH95269.1 hypothetical protein Psi01_58990 [Planobispora siamensis]
MTVVWIICGAVILAGVIGAVPDEALTLTAYLYDVTTAAGAREVAAAILGVIGVCLLYAGSGLTRGVVLGAAAVALYANKLVIRVDAGVQRLEVTRLRQPVLERGADA